MDAKIFLCFLLVIVLVSESSAQSSLIGNTVLDQAFGILKKQQNLEVVVLPEFYVPFGAIGNTLQFDGGIRMQNGFVAGINSIQRVGDVDIEFGTSLKISVPLQLTDVGFGYSIGIQFLGIGIYPQTAIYIRRVRLYLKARVDLANNIIIVEHLDIYDIGEIDLKISRLGLLGGILEAVIEALLNGVKQQLADVLETTIKEEINKQLSNLKISPSDLLGGAAGRGPFSSVLLGGQAASNLVSIFTPSVLPDAASNLANLGRAIGVFRQTRSGSTNILRPFERNVRRGVPLDLNKLLPKGFQAAIASEIFDRSNKPSNRRRGRSGSRNISINIPSTNGRVQTFSLPNFGMRIAPEIQSRASFDRRLKHLPEVTPPGLAKFVAKMAPVIRSRARIGSKNFGIDRPPIS